jgi:hypothetical protein
MGLSAPRHLFGIHSIVFYNRATKLPYGPIVKVLASGGIEMASEFEDLTGGSEKFVVASESKLVTTELKFTAKEYPDFMFELFLGATVTQNSAEASGNVSSLTNVNGTSVQNATAGIASIAALAGSEANLKFGKFVIKAMSATTVNVYGSSDIDFNRGTDVAYQDDTLKILAADVTIPASGATVSIASLGLELTGGSAGAIAMTSGDTAEFAVRPINQGNSVIEVGASTSSFPEFGCFLYTQKRSSSEYFEIEVYKAVGAGLPLLAEEKTWSQAELTIKVLKDFEKDKIMTIRAIKAA